MVIKDYRNIFVAVNFNLPQPTGYDIKKPFDEFIKGANCLLNWEVGDKILTNYAYDVYEMSPYLIEMKSWLVELDEQKKDKERPIII